MIKTITNKLFLLVTMLLLSTVNALADDVAKIGNVGYATLQEAFNAAQDGQTITLLANETLEAEAKLTVAAGKNIVLDLNGKTIAGSTAVNNATFYFLTNKGTLTVTDTSVNKDGKITFTATNPHTGYKYEYVTIYNQGALTLAEGTIEGTSAYLTYAVNTSSNAWGIGDDKNCVFNMTGGKLLAPNGDASLRVYQNCAPVNNPLSHNTVNISGGYMDKGIFVDQIVQSNHANLANWKGDNVNTQVNIEGGTINGLIDMKMRHPFNTVLNITGGTFTNSHLRVRVGDGSVFSTVGWPTATYVNISGGNFEFGSSNLTSTDWQQNYLPFALTGGTYSVDPSAYVAEGYEAVDNGDDTWTVQEAIGPVMILGGEEEGAYYATVEEAFAAVQDGQTISLNENITLSDALNLTLAGKTVTLDLGSYTLTGRVNLKSGILTVQNGTVANPNGQALNVYGSATANTTNYSVLNVNCNVQEADFGVCMFGATASTNGYGAVVNILPAANLDCTGEGTIFVSGNLGNNIAGDMNNVINIEGQVYGPNSVGVALNGNATVNVKEGAMITGNTAIAIKRGVLNVIGGTVWGEGDEKLNPSANNNGVELTGAAISMTDTYNNYGSMAVNISGGDIISDKSVALFKKEGNYTNAATFAVSGGTFSSPVPADFCAEGYVPTALGNNQYGVKQAEPVAKIGDVEYTTLAEAIAAANATGNVTINLLTDYDFEANEPGYGYTTSFLAQGENAARNNMLVFSADNITFDLGGHTISNLFNNTFQVTGSNVTFQNGGMRVGQLYYSDLNGNVYTSENQKTCSYIVYVEGATNFTVNSLTTYGGINVSASTATINDLSFSGTKFYAVCSQNNSTVTLNGGTYTKALTGAAGNMFWVQAGSVMNIVGGTYTKGSLTKFINGINPVITGGTFDFDPTNNGVAAGYEAVANGNGTWTVSPAAVAKIGETEYTTLEAAFAAAEDGQTITLLRDCSGNGIIAPQGKFATGLTVDFAGFTYTVDGTTLAGSAGTKTQAFQLLKDNKITFTNGAIVGNTADVKMLIQNYSDLTLSYMTLDATQGTNSVNYVLSTNNGNTVINHTTITAKTNGKAFDVDSGWGNYESNSVQLMGNSVINGDIEVAFEGKTAGEPSVLTLTVGTLNGNIVMGTGANKCTVIKDAYFVADPPADYEWKENDNYTLILKPKEYTNDVTDGETVVATETATITNGEATITNVEIAPEKDVKNVTVSATVNDVPVTEIADGAFASLAGSNVAVVDLSNTQINLGETSRSASPVLQGIPEDALIYLPSSSNKVEGTNVVIKQAGEESSYVCENFEAVDRKACVVPHVFTAKQATYKRTFTVNAASTLFLPYEIDASAIAGTVYAYTAMTSAKQIEMTEMTGTLPANTPYIIIPTAEDAKVTKANVTVQVEESPGVTYGYYTFKGSNETRDFTATECANGVYGFYGNSIPGKTTQDQTIGTFVKFAIGSRVAATRCYLEATDISGAPGLNGANAAANKPASIKVILKKATGETTGILDFELDTAEDGTPVYTLSGQRAVKGSKGILIKGGKKVLVK